MTRIFFSRSECDRGRFEFCFLYTEDGTQRGILISGSERYFTLRNDGDRCDSWQLVRPREKNYVAIWGRWVVTEDLLGSPRKTCSEQIFLSTQERWQPATDLCKLVVTLTDGYVVGWAGSAASGHHLTSSASRQSFRSVQYHKCSRLSTSIC